MTEEQEKYIIEKYPYFWNGAYCPSGFTWTADLLHLQNRSFANYINISKKIFALKEKEKIPRLLTDKSYTNYREYIRIVSVKNTRHLKEYNRMKYMLYFAKPKVSFENFDKYFPFCFSLFNLTGRSKTYVEKKLNTIIDDAMLVYEIVRPDIIYNACSTKDMVLLKDNFDRINQILLKYNKYVYRANDRLYGYINPTKIKQFKYLIKLLKKNKYIKKYDGCSMVINEEVISKTVFFMYYTSFMNELHLYNSAVFYGRVVNICKLQHKVALNKKKTNVKCPHKLQLIFDEVRKYDNEIINQQKNK